MPTPEELENIGKLEASPVAPKSDPTRDMMAKLHAHERKLRAEAEAPIYLYITEDGQILKSYTAPTIADFSAEAEGLLDIVRITGREVVHLTHDGVVQLPLAAVHTDTEVGLYHAKEK